MMRARTHCEVKLVWRYRCGAIQPSHAETIDRSRLYWATGFNESRPLVRVSVQAFGLVHYHRSKARLLVFARAWTWVSPQRRKGRKGGAESSNTALVFDHNSAPPLRPLRLCGEASFREFRNGCKLKFRQWQYRDPHPRWDDGETVSTVSNPSIASSKVPAESVTQW